MHVYERNFFITGPFAPKFHWNFNHEFPFCFLALLNANGSFYCMLRLNSKNDQIKADHSYRSNIGSNTTSSMQQKLPLALSKAKNQKRSTCLKSQ